MASGGLESLTALTSPLAGDGTGTRSPVPPDEDLLFPLDDEERTNRHLLRVCESPDLDLPGPQNWCLWNILSRPGQEASSPLSDG